MHDILDLWNMDLPSLAKLLFSSTIEMMGKVKENDDYMREL
jgi:hypothetical protein